jgi:hypothetical protein
VAHGEYFLSACEPVMILFKNTHVIYLFVNSHPISCFIQKQEKYSNPFEMDREAVPEDPKRK